MRKHLVAAASILVLAGPASATTRIVTLSLPTMDCPVCPITVKKALTRVPGVDTTEVNFDKRQAVVTFDDAKINTNVLTKATTDAGYPSTVLK